MNFYGTDDGRTAIEMLEATTETEKIPNELFTYDNVNKSKKEDLKMKIVYSQNSGTWKMDASKSEKLKYLLPAVASTSFQYKGNFISSDFVKCIRI